MAADSWIRGGGGSLGSAESCSLCRGSSLSAPPAFICSFTSPTTEYFFVDFGRFNSLRSLGCDSVLDSSTVATHRPGACLACFGATKWISVCCSDSVQWLMNFSIDTIQELPQRRLLGVRQ